MNLNLSVRLEALLFAADQPLAMQKLQEVLNDASRKDIEESIQRLEREYEAPERAFHLTRVAGGFQLTTKRDFADLVRRLYVGKRRVRLTRAALEAMAIIAYKQPTTRPEIDAIRGVSSGGVVETLLERNLVRIAGRAEGVGRPLLYATTQEFLQYLGLNHLKDLPSLSELAAMLAEREAEARREEEEELRELAADAPEAATDEPQVLETVSVDEKLRASDLATLDQLDEELLIRGGELQELSSRIKQAQHEDAEEPAAAVLETAAAESGPEAAEAQEAPAESSAEAAPTLSSSAAQVDAQPEPGDPEAAPDPSAILAESEEASTDAASSSAAEAEPRSR